jgi:hypothetical protein
MYHLDYARVPPDVQPPRWCAAIPQPWFRILIAIADAHSPGMAPLQRSITHRGFGRGRSNWRPTFGALGRPTNRNKGYTAGTRRMTSV